MKALQEILSNYKEWEIELDDRFGVRLCSFLTVEQAETIGFRFKPEYATTHKPLPWTRENVLAQLKKDVEFGFEKALNKRGISSGLMFDVVSKWNKVLEEGLEDFSEDNYAQYGLPLFKATAVDKIGLTFKIDGGDFDNPEVKAWLKRQRRKEV